MVCHPAPSRASSTRGSFGGSAIPTEVDASSRSSSRGTTPHCSGPLRSTPQRRTRRSEVRWRHRRPLFSAFPLLNVVYEAQAGVPPLDEAGAAIMEELANGGYRPAQRTIDRILAAGNHPQAGAQSSGAVADGVQPDVYDHFAMNYHGPLSPDAREAVANRTAYLDWVARIADWVASGATMDQVPSVPTFLTAGAAGPTASAPTADRRNAC